MRGGGEGLVLLGGVGCRVCTGRCVTSGVLIPTIPPPPPPPPPPNTHTRTQRDNTGHMGDDTAGWSAVISKGIAVGFELCLFLYGALFCS